MSPEYIDIHCHIESKDFHEDQTDVVERMRKNNVWGISVGTDIKTSKQVVELSDKYPHIFACIGVHPRDDTRGEFVTTEFETLVSHPKVVAIGECGLDYFRFDGDLELEKKRQKELFEKQIYFAVKHNKPLMLHCRDAYEDSLDILEVYAKEYGERLRGDAHFFAGDIDIAKRLFDIGFSISFTGVITFARNYDEVVRYSPLDMIMSETDAPWVAPIPFRGRRNEPIYVQHVVEQIAIIRHEEYSGIKHAMTGNAQKMFGLSFK